MAYQGITICEVHYEEENTRSLKLRNWLSKDRRIAGASVEIWFCGSVPTN